MAPKEMPDSELRSKLLWIIFLRVAILGPLLTFASIIRTQHLAGSLGVFWLALYTLSLIHFLTVRFLPRPVLAFYAQMLTDLLFVTLLIYRSGDFSSIFVPLYLLVIIYCSVVQQRRGGITATALALFSYLATLSANYFGPGALQAAPLLRETALTIALNLMSFLGVGYLGVSLSERLQLIRLELGEKEDSLAQLQALHNNIVSSIRSGLLTTDLQGNITSFNPAAEEITRHNERHILGRPCSVIIGEAGLRRLLRTDFTRLRRALRSEVWTRDALGRWRYIGFGASPLISQGDRIIGSTISFQDLTEIKRLEEEVQLKEKMAAIGNLVAGIAHELRNPLGAIAGSVQVLKGDPQSSADSARLLDVVLRESARLNKIIEDLLCYASPRKPVLAPVALAQLLDETLELARNDPAFLTCRITVEKPDNLHLCLASPDQIKQVFWNLVTNASKAMPGGGNLTIRLAHSSRYVKATFRDEGVGMTTRQRNRLFQPFATGFAGGAGLGMALVYQIVQRHGGRIKVRSQRNHGTAVTIALPRAHEQATFEPRQSDAAAPRAMTALAEEMTAPARRG